MKRNLILGMMTLFATSLVAADAGKDKETITAAAKKLAGNSYSWESKIEMAGGGGGGGGGRGRPGPTKGKIDKDGTAVLNITRGENTMDAVVKAGKGAIKTEDGWKSLAEAGEGDGQPNPSRFLARTLQNFKSPAAEAEDLAGKVKELKKEGDVYSGDLTEDGAKSLLSSGGRGGGNAPAVSNAKGSVKFWVKDGLLSKYEHKVKGSVSFNGTDREIDRTTTVEIKDVGTTKATVPDDARKKLS